MMHCPSSTATAMQTTTSLHHAGAHPRVSCANRDPLACRTLDNVPARMPQSAIRLASLQPAAHATTRSKAVVVSMYDTALCTGPSKSVMRSTVPCAATLGGEGAGQTGGQHVVHMERPLARPTRAAGGAAPTYPSSQQQLFAHPAHAAAGAATANHATQEPPSAHPAPAASAAAVTVPAMQQQPLTPTAPVATGAATTGCVMQEQLGAPSVSACAAGAAAADPGDGAVVSFWCGMHTPRNAAAALGGVVSPPVLHCSAAAGTPSAPLHVQAAAGGRRAWRSACPNHTTVAPCSRVAVHAGKSAGGVPRASSPEERRENLCKLIEEAAKEHQVSDEDVSLLDEEELSVLVKEKWTIQTVLLDTPYDELVAAGITAGAAEVLKMLFPGPSTAEKGQLDALAAAVNSRGFEGSLSDGIVAKLLTKSSYAPRKALVDDTIRLAASKGVVILKGPPWAGKTSLLQLLFIRLQELKQRKALHDVVFLKATDCPRGMSWDDFVYWKLGQTWADLTFPPLGAKVFIIIDELQALYSGKPELHNSLWTTIKVVLAGGGFSSNAPGSDVRIIASALYEDTPSVRAATGIEIALRPYDITDDQVISMRPTWAMQLGLTLPVDEYHQLFMGTWAQQDLPLPLLFNGDYTQDKIMELANGHVGLITLMLQRLYDDFNVARQRDQNFDALRRMAAKANMGICDLLFRRAFREGAFYDYLSNMRGFIKVDTVDTETTQMYELMLPLLLSANQPVPVHSLNTALTERLEQLRLAGLVEVTANDSVDDTWWLKPPMKVYSLPTKLHLRYYGHQLLKCQPMRVHASEDSLEAVLRLAFTRMSASRLRTTLRKGAGDRVVEEKFQAEVIVALSSVLPRDWNVCPEIEGKYSDVKSTKRLDFMITPACWALELLRDGDDLVEHEERFKAGGDYEECGWKAYAVVDLRSFPYAEPQLREDEPNTYFVLFQDKEYKQAKLVHASTKREWLMVLAP